MEINEYLKKFSEKLSIPIEEVESEYNKLLEEEKLIHKDLDLDNQKQRALQRLALTYKKQLRSPAVGFEGIVIGISDCVDIIARQKREAKELYKLDPHTAISEGVTDEEGSPLDTRKEWATGRKNPSYGKVLPENNYMRSIFGIAVKSKAKDKPKFFSITINGSKATDDNISVFTPMRFMAIDKTLPDNAKNEYNLNASTFTNFTADEKLILPDYRELLASCCNDMFIDLKKLNEYHDATKDNFNRLVVVEGDVSSLRLEPTGFGSRVMVIEDIKSSLEDLDVKGLTCWIPERTDIDFAEGSKVIVIGRTAQGKKKDDLGNITEELGDVTLNVFGLYAIPEYKVSLPEDILPITEESLDIE